MGPEELAQRFLDAVSRRAGEFELQIGDIAEEYASAADEKGIVRWSFSKAESCPWFSSLQAKLPTRLPLSVEALYGHYRFLPFAVGGLQLMGNTGMPGRFELLSYVDSDPHMSPLLLRKGMIPFARLDTGSYDPVCLDVRQHVKNREYPLVLVDHESALIKSSVMVRRTFAQSFLVFMTEIAGG